MSFRECTQWIQVTFSPQIFLSSCFVELRLWNSWLQEACSSQAVPGSWECRPRALGFLVCDFQDQLQSGVEGYQGLALRPLGAAWLGAWSAPGLLRLTVMNSRLEVVTFQRHSASGKRAIHWYCLPSRQASWLPHSDTLAILGFPFVLSCLVSDAVWKKLGCSGTVCCCPLQAVQTQYHTLFVMLSQPAHFIRS